MGKDVRKGELVAVPSSDAHMADAIGRFSADYSLVEKLRAKKT